MTVSQAESYITNVLYQARLIWRQNDYVRQAAVLFGMTERSYAMRYLDLAGPITWFTSGSSTSPLPEPIDFDALYDQTSAWLREAADD